MDKGLKLYRMSDLKLNWKPERPVLKLLTSNRHETYVRP
jgi:hypothetical protein